LAELDGPLKGKAITPLVEHEVLMRVEETSSITIELSLVIELLVEVKKIAKSITTNKKKKKKEKVKIGAEEKTEKEVAIDDKKQVVKQEKCLGFFAEGDAIRKLCQNNNVVGETNV